MENIQGILDGFIILLNPSIFVYVLIGFIIGEFFGAMPGLTSALAIALILPVTYSMDIVRSLVMCMGVYMAGLYAGSITAITINIPGAPSNVMTAIEGNLLMQKGQGAKALGHAAFASMIGGVIGSILLMLFAPFSLKLALLIRTPGKFSLIFFALVVIILINRKSLAKGAIATFMGIMFGTIGIDLMKPVARFIFGFDVLVEGIDLMAVIIGTFAISEILIQAEKSHEEVSLKIDETRHKFKRSDFTPKWKDIKEIGLLAYIKNAFIGFFIGVLPGAGGSMASFIAYSEAIRCSNHPEKFGTSETVEGIAAAETANNAVCGGALVPMLTFGIPGDATTAIVLGVLIINGLQPGPQLMSNQFHLVAPMFAALFVSALVLIPLSVYLIGPYFIRIALLDRGILYAIIATVAIVGSYVSTFSVFQMFMALITGVIAYIFRKNKFPIVCFLLGFILGPMAEDYLRRGLSLGHGSPMIFFTSPDSIFFLVLTVIFYYFLIIKKPVIPNK